MSGGLYGRGKAPERQCLPIAEWPADDRRLWLEACTPGSIFDEEIGLRAGHAAISNTKDQKGYGRWLTWLRINEPECLKGPPAGRITLERVKDYTLGLKALGNSSQTILARLQELGAVAKVMEPTAPWRFINRLSARIRSGHKPARGKLALRPANELLELGLALMISDVALSPLQAAITYRDGLIIAFLALMPLRRRNLADLELGRSLREARQGWRVVFEEDETKTHAVYEVLVPEVLHQPLAAYLNVHRPLLAGRDGRWHSDPGHMLWISKDGSPMTQMAIYDRIRARTKSAFGAAINPHLFRDAAATTMAVEDPRHVRIAAPLLGHRTFSTTEKYYQQATGLEAQRSFLAVIEELKRGGKNV